MKTSINYFLSCCFLLLAVKSIAQSKKIDSLKFILKTAKADSNRVNALNALAKAFKTTEPDTALKYATEAIALGKKLNKKTAVGNAYAMIGSIQYHKGNFPEALENNEAALAIRREMKDTLGISKSLGVIGLNYLELGNYPVALDNFLNSLKIAEKINDESQISAQLGNIGILYSTIGQHQKALEYLLKAEKIYEARQSRNDIIINLDAIAIAYSRLQEYDKALVYYTRTLNMAYDANDKENICRAMGNIGIAYGDRGNIDSALYYDRKSLQLAYEIGASEEIASNLGYIATQLVKQKDTKGAENYFLRSIAVSDSIGKLDFTMVFEQELSALYSSEGNFEKALKHFQRYTEVKDKIFSDENTKKQTRTEMQYEFDKKESGVKAAQEKKDAVTEADRKRQEIILWFVVAGLLLVLAFAGFIYRGYLQKQKANIEILKQKLIVEEKQKEILDSIHYAKRIQRSLLPTEKYIVKTLNRLTNKS